MSDLTMTWGRRMTYAGTLLGSDGLPLTVSTSGLAFTAKHSTADADASAVVVKTLTDGIVILDDAAGTFQVQLDAADTAGLDPDSGTRLLWDLTAWDVTPDEPLETGTLTVKPAIGRTAP